VLLDPKIPPAKYIPLSLQPLSQRLCCWLFSRQLPLSVARAAAYERHCDLHAHARVDALDDGQTFSRPQRSHLQTPPALQLLLPELTNDACKPVNPLGERNSLLQAMLSSSSAAGVAAGAARDERLAPNR
jgi:hypothetical protein